VAVGLRPQADASRHRLGERMLQIELAVEIALNLCAADANLEVVPLMRRFGVFRTQLTEERLPFSNFHSTRLFSRQFARIVR